MKKEMKQNPKDIEKEALKVWKNKARCDFPQKERDRGTVILRMPVTSRIDRICRVLITEIRTASTLSLM